MNDKPNYSLETGLASAIAAKNSMKNVYGFSPNQLVFGKYPNFPNIRSNKLPVLEGATWSKIVAESFSAMHDATQAFIKSESDEKLRQALWHQLRASSEVTYFTGDKVYQVHHEKMTITRDHPRSWSRNQQVLIKHGSTYQRMHPCRLHLIDCLYLLEMEQNPENKEELNSYESKEIWVSGNN